LSASTCYYIYNAVFIIIIGPGRGKKNPIKSSENTWRSPSDRAQIDLATNNGDINLSYDGGDRDRRWSTTCTPPSPRFLAGLLAIPRQIENRLFAGNRRTYTCNSSYRIVRIRRDVNACVSRRSAAEGTGTRRIFPQKYTSSFDCILRVLFYNVVEFGCHVATSQRIIQRTMRRIDNNPNDPKTIDIHIILYIDIEFESKS